MPGIPLARKSDMGHELDHSHCREIELEGRTRMQSSLPVSQRINSAIGAMGGGTVLPHESATTKDPDRRISGKAGNVSSRISGARNCLETMEPQAGPLEVINTARWGWESPKQTIASRALEPQALRLSWNEANCGR